MEKTKQEQIDEKKECKHSWSEVSAQLAGDDDIEFSVTCDLCGAVCIATGKWDDKGGD